MTRRSSRTRRPPDCSSGSSAATASATSPAGSWCRRSGSGRETNWFRSLLADPTVELMLPGRTLTGTAEEVTDADERARVVPRIIRASGVPGFMIGCNPWTAGDERILELLTGIPLVRIRPTGIASGPADPGGLLWVVKLLLAVLLVRRLLGRRRET